MSKQKYPHTKADLVTLPDNFVAAQSFDGSNVHAGTPLNTAIAQLLRAAINVGNIAALSTEDKTNLVAAINELIANAPLVRTENGGYRITGSPTVASAANAFAEGNRTKATETSAHAEGSRTEATGMASHAEGSSSYANADYSHAEGKETETLGEASHAEGGSCVSYGEASHAEGKIVWQERTVTRQYTAGEAYLYVNEKVADKWVITDNKTIAVLQCVYQNDQGDYQLSLSDNGFDNDIAINKAVYVAPSAYGTGSHTEGYQNVAGGSYSHAEGSNTQTTNEAEHASGKFNLSTPNVTQYSVGVGTTDNARVNAYEVTLDGKIYVKGIGGYDGTNVTATGVKALGEDGWLVGSISYNDLTDKPILKTLEGGYTIGTYSQAHATDSVAFGAGFAIGNYSIAEGVGSVSFGEGSHAEGMSIAAGARSHTEGAHTFAWAPATHNEGYYTVTMWYYSHAEGSYVLASGLAAHAEGLGFIDGDVITPVKRFHLIVCNDRIEFKNDEGISIHDVLYQPALVLSINSGQKVIDLPLEVVAYNSATNEVLLRDQDAYMTGDYAFLQGYKSEEGTTITCVIPKSGAQGNFSHVEGNNTRALDDGAHAEGIKTKALGLGSHAEGNNSDERFEVIVDGDTVMSDSPSQDTTVILDLPGTSPDSANFNNIGVGIAVARISYRKSNDTLHGFLRVKGTGVDAETGSPYISLAYAEEMAGRTIPAGSAIEIYYSGALGAAAHAEGYNTAAAGEASHAEGYYTQTSNASEHAEGTYNLSTPNKTLSSVGIGSGTGQTPRINAYEVDLQGNFYIKGIGNYDGTNITASGVKSVQQVITDLTNALNGNNS